MMIRSVTIQGFRSIHHMNLTLSRLNIVSGPNGCGKSNLYKAYVSCMKLQMANYPKPLQMRAGFKKSCGQVVTVRVIDRKTLSA